MELANAVNAFLQEKGLGPSDYTDYCHTLAYRANKWLEEHGIEGNLLWMRHVERDSRIFPSTLPGREWRYHVAVEIEGMVHDTWFPEILPRDEYLRRMFPDQPITCFVGRWDWDTIYKQTATPKYAAACCDCESCRANWVD